MRSLDAVLHAQRRFANVQDNLPRKLAVLPTNSEQVFRHPQRKILLVPRLQLDVNQFPVRRFTQQIDAPVADLRSLHVEPLERRCTSELSQHCTTRLRQDVFQRYIVFVHRA